MDGLSARCWVLHAFDVARAISLATCRDRIPVREVADTRRPQWPHLFGLDQRPLVWDLDPVEATLGGRRVTLHPSAIIYDFGSVSVALRCDADGSVEAWRALAVALNAAAADLATIARDVVDRFVARAADALVDARRIDDVEAYRVWQVDEAPGGDATAWALAHRRVLAQVLRGEDTAFCEDEVDDALSRRIAYATGDLVVVDGEAALVVDRAWADTVAVLDFANCEHLALRSLDDDLDRAVADAVVMERSRRSRWRILMSPWGRDVRRLTRLTLDASAELEAVANAIKLTDDHYLARVYRLAVERFHLGPFHDGINRKLATLWNVQKVFLDHAAHRRNEILEWIIILLIAFEIVQALAE